MRKNKVIFEETRCHDCGKPLPKGKGQRSFYCRLIGLCQYCYRHKHPRHDRTGNLKPQLAQDLMSWDERRWLERLGFDESIWSQAFREEWLDYWEAWMRGEI